MKPIPNFEDYLVTTDGRIFSNKRNPLRELNYYTNEGGYLKVWLYKEGKRKMMFVHRAVAIAYIDNPLNKDTVNHIDGIKTNNDISNLEWMTTQENTIHAQKVIKVIPDVFTDEVVSNIQRLRKHNKTCEQIADDLGYPLHRVVLACKGDGVNSRKRNHGKGYSYHKQAKKWRARIRGLDGNMISLGLHHTEEEARKAFELARREIYELS